nr:ribonuclease H-like domain-containing protein [Tanacetum cinerariifolium]
MYDIHHHLEAPLDTTSTSTIDPLHDSNNSLVVMWMYSTISPKIVDMISDDSATTHAIKSKSDRLVNLGSPVKDLSFVTYAINGVLSKFLEVARIIPHMEKLPTFDEVRSMILLKESDVLDILNAHSSLHTTSFSPIVLVATNASTARTNTMSTSDLEERRNFHPGTCTYGAPCKFVHGIHDARPRPQYTGLNDKSINTWTTGKTSSCAPTPSRSLNVCESTENSTTQEFKVVEEILEKEHMQKCNPCKTLVDIESKLGPDGDPTLYHSLAGALKYLTFTRPNLSYAAQQVCLYMHDTRDPHFTALKRILRYAGFPVTHRSTAGYCVFLGDNLLSWSAKRQVTLSRSSPETKYRGVANVVDETVWLQMWPSECVVLKFRSSLNVRRPPVQTVGEY